MVFDIPKIIGTHVYDIKQEKNIYENFIEIDKALQIIRICKENSIFFSVYTTQGIITESLNYNINLALLVIKKIV